jgi:hypothetical protein
VAIGAPAELVDRSNARQTVTFVSAPALEQGLLAALPGVENLSCENGVMRFCTAQATPTLAALAALLHARKSEVIDLQVRKASLEEVFLGVARETPATPPVAS